MSNPEELFILLFTLGPSYNQPKLCPNAVWAANGITFIDAHEVGLYPNGVFVNRKNLIYVSSYALNLVLAWSTQSATLVRNVSGGSNGSLSVFVTINDDVYVDRTFWDRRIDKWTSSSLNSTPVMYGTGTCFDIFVDLYDNIYCSAGDEHRVIKRSFNNAPNTIRTVAGSGTNGSNSTMLWNPRGIFVDDQFNLYVADLSNQRIQRFRAGERNGTTMAGKGAPQTIALTAPVAVILDADGYLFIVDVTDNRIIASGPNGFRCIAGCTGVGGPAPDQLNGPRKISFDSIGNIFVTDTMNSRIQKFVLEKNKCGKH